MIYKGYLRSYPRFGGKNMSYKDNIRRVTPYTPGEQPKETNIIKLNTNECPYYPSLRVRDKIKELDLNHFRLYPDPAASDLVKAWADYNGLDEDQVFVGVGSDDVLSMCFLTYFNSDKPVLFPDITYSFYDVWCDVYRIPYKRVPLNDNFEIEVSDYVDASKGGVLEVMPGGIVIANPNAPTGTELSLDKIEKIIKANQDCVVIIDEAYVDFGGTSAIPLIDKYPNVVVVQTFSKSRAMAGLRIGYAMGSKELIKALNDVKYSVNSYTMNYPSIVLGVAAIEDSEYFKAVCDKIIATRENAKVRLSELGFSFADSKTNFIFAKHKSVSGDYIFNELRNRGIYVRHWNKERIEDYLRITIGTDEQMEDLYSALKEIVM